MSVLLEYIFGIFSELFEQICYNQLKESVFKSISYRYFRDDVGAS